MKLPSHVSYCIETLEGAGFAAYAVGGCVRDWTLGLPPHDFDLCTAALPEDIQRLFAGYGLVTAGVKHGTVGVIFDRDVVEITTFRKEGDYADGRHPDWVAFVEDVEEDLARRDFTVNAMAWSPTRGLADPFGGQADLQRKILRTVRRPEDRFREDPLRILRGARFAAKYQLTPEPETLDAMITLVPLMEGLARERMFSELCKLLLHARWEDLLRYAPLITQVIPELAAAVGFDQHSPYHQFDLYTHIAHVTAAVPRELPVRWAALLHDVGKPATFTMDEAGRGHFYGHAQEGSAMADAILRRLKAPNQLRLQVTRLIELHMNRPEPHRKTVRRWISQMGRETFLQLLALQQADMGGKGTEPEAAPFDALRELAQELSREEACLSLRDLAIDGGDLLALGVPEGKGIGQCLRSLLEQVMEEQLPNDRDRLLEAAKKYFDTEYELKVHF